MLRAAPHAFAVLALVLGHAPTQDLLPTQQCGLGKEFHAGRRKALGEALGGGVVVLRGLPPTRTNTRFSQDKTFWYFTGVESPDAALVVDLATGHETLFLPGRDRGKESWEGEQWDVEDEWVRGATGIDDIQPTNALAAALAELLPGKEVHDQAATSEAAAGAAGQADALAAPATVWTSLAPHITLAGSYDRAGPFDRQAARDPFDGRVARERAFAAKLAARFAVEVKDITAAANKLRRVKTPQELQAMQRAATAGALAMSEAMRSTRPGLLESDLEAVLDLVHRRNGAAGPAYQAIVGSGANSLVLHYIDNRRRMADGDVVLVDYAPEVDHYVCDITRTWPVNGKFTPRQAELYDAVLAAQEAGIARAGPDCGLADVERACRQEIQRRGFAHLVRHGACHLIGMEVHDPGFTRGKLAPGVAFTIEPGLYEEETGIGIRIEDVVVITKDGCEVLSRTVPKLREEIEALIAAPGVLDWLDGPGK